MAERKFRFVSPGIFINEVDNSQLPNDLPDVGPIIVGRAERGPAMRPIRVNSPSEFIEYFGAPIPGGRGDDVWRDGNYVGPTYGAYAAMAYLRAGVGPVNYVRLLGAQHPEATTAGYAGWDTGDQTTPGTTHATAGGAYGLFLFPSASGGSGNMMTNQDVGNGRLAAVFYTDGAHVSLSGSDAVGVDEQGSLGFIKASDAGPEFTAVIEDSGGTQATLVNAIDCTGIPDDGEFTITVPVAVGGDGVAHKISIVANDAAVDAISDSSNDFGIAKTTASSDALKAAAIVDAINGVVNSAVGYSGGAVGTVLAAGTLGVTAAITDGETAKITLTMTKPGADGNVANILAANTGFAGDLLLESAFTGGADDTTVYKTSFNFDRNSSKYIRKVFNTNPQLGNTRHTTDVSNLADKYWLGETFERFGTEHIDTTAANYGIIVPLHNGQATVADNNNFGKKRRGFEDPETGFVFSQNTSTTYDGFDAQTNTQNLFKFKALNHAEWASRNLKISISDIKASVNDLDSYGTFTVLVRRAGDSDNVPEIIEQFSNCNLNPASENYIAKKIGDRYMVWDTTQRRLRQYGEFDNMSKYIYVEMNASVSDGTADASLVPFGFYGPVKPKDFSVGFGKTATYLSGGVVTEIQTYATGSSANTPNGVTVGNTLSNTTFLGGAANLTASFKFPVLPTRVSASDGGISNPKDAFFGIQPTLSADSKRFDPGYIDYLRGAPGTSGVFVPSTTDGAVGNAMEYSFIFTLDDISGSQGVHVSGSAQESTAASKSLNASSGSYTGSLDAGYNRFTMPLWGGHNGVDISEMEPFNNGAIGSGTNEKASYPFYTVKRAVDTVADPEFVEGNILSVPGVTQPGITDQVIAVAESRADALAVIDIENVYVPNTETTDSYQSRVKSVAGAVSSLKQRRINSSYGCTFYPWVRIRDDISNASLWVPPSVIAIGTFASSEAKAELWFAPAGFTRGGLSTGAGGFGVLSTTERLRREDRDDLYEANINPIATFPSEGIVIFGQKTLQVTPSALDRINVRRLMIFLKKRISRIAAGILFDQNVKTTWTRFKTEADKFLAGVQANLGLTEFRVVLDETTTTPDLVDRNILYAKIFLKPARAIEFIAIDFVITRTGASFDD